MEEKRIVYQKEGPGSNNSLEGSEWRSELERLKRTAQEDFQNPKAIRTQKGPDRRPTSAKTDALGPRTAWGQQRQPHAEISSNDDPEANKSRTGSTNKLGQYSAIGRRGYHSLLTKNSSDKKWVPKFARMIPRNIMHDKETLYDNTLQLKQYANGLIEENHVLKAKLQQLEEDLSRKGKLLNGLMAQMGSLSSMQGIQRMQKETHLIEALKQRVRRAEGIIHEREEEITELKKNIKVTKLGEYETQLRICENECVRLRGMLDELINSKHVGNPTEYVEIEEKLLEQAMLLKDLQRKNLELSSELDRKARESEKLAEQVQELEGQLTKGQRKTDQASKHKRALAEYKEKMVEMNGEIAQLRAELASKPVIASTDHKNDQDSKLVADLHNEIEQVKKEKDEYKEKFEEIHRGLLEKDGIIKKLQDRLKEQEEEFSVKLIQEKEQFNKKFHALEREIDVMKSKEPKDQSKPSLEANKSSHRVDIRKLVANKDLYYTKFELRARLLLSKTSKEKFFQTLFEGYHPAESISIKELTKGLSKEYLGLSSIQGELIARYVIEPEDKPEIEFNWYRDRNLAEVKKSLEEVLGISYTFSENEEVERATKQALEKVRKNMSQIIKYLGEGTVNVKKWREVFQDLVPDLDPIEKDLLIAIGFERNKDMDMLDIKDVVKRVEGIQGKKEKSPPLEEVEKQKPVEPIAKVKEMVRSLPQEERRLSELVVDTQPKIEQENMFGNVGWKKAEEPAQSDRPSEPSPALKESPNVDQEEIEEVQRVVNDYMDRIKRKLSSTNKRMTDLIYDYVVLGEVDGTEYQVVPMNNLMDIIKEICSTEFAEEEFKDIEEIFAQLGNSEYVFFESLLEFFGELPLEDTPEEKNYEHPVAASEQPKSEALEVEYTEDRSGEAPAEGKKKRRSVKDLDDLSVQTIMQLTKYIHENEVKLYDLLGDAITRKIVKTKNKQREIDVMQSEDFFGILKRIGIEPYVEYEDSLYEHKNLSDFLCIDRTNYPTILSVKKLQQTIQFFATDPVMRSSAEEYFTKLAESARPEQAPEPVYVEKVEEKQEHDNILAGQLAALQKESDFAKKDHFNYDQEFPVENKPEAKVPEKKEPEQKTHHAMVEDNKDADEYKDDFATEPKNHPVEDNQPQAKEEDNNNEETKKEGKEEEEMNDVLADQLAALQKEDRKEHDDVTKRQLGERYNYDEEFVIESEPEGKTPREPEQKAHHAPTKSEISGAGEIVVQPHLVGNSKDTEEYKDDFATDQEKSEQPLEEQGVKEEKGKNEDPNEIEEAIVDAMMEEDGEIPEVDI